MSTTAADRISPDRAARDAEALAALTAGPDAPARPLLLTGGAVISMNPLLGDWEQADLLIGGDVIVGVGPGLLTAAGDDNMIVIDCAGSVVLPAAMNFLDPDGTGSLTPGRRADIAVVRIADAEGIPARAVPHRGSHLDIAVDGGRVRIWRGRPLDAAPGQTPEAVAVPAGTTNHPYVGLWVDEHDFVRQELLPDGRYDEARGDRASAYQGRYWIDGIRIDYLDDLGFWAFGEFDGETLHHAGYRFIRR
jgi:hypothetical protein